MIELSKKHLSIIQQILSDFVPDCEVRAFGSRTNGTSHAGSDLDLVIMRNELLEWELMVKLKNAFAESYLPFEVDVLDWNAIPLNFKENIGKKYEVVQKAATNGK
jgi:uncharacterized protein